MDLSTFIGIILAIDGGAVVGTLFAIKPEVEKALEKSDNKELFRTDAPLVWLSNANRFFILSLFASLAYLIFISFNFGVGTMPFGSDYMLFFSLGFFVFAFIHLLRVSEFIYSPSSMTHVTISKIYYWFVEIAVRVSLIAFYICLEIINAIMFYAIVFGLIAKGYITIVGIVYASSITISFATAYLVIWDVVFHLRKKATRKDELVYVGFLSPWIILTIIGLLMSLGFKPL